MDTKRNVFPQNEALIKLGQSTAPGPKGSFYCVAIYLLLQLPFCTFKRENMAARHCLDYTRMTLA